MSRISVPFLGVLAAAAFLSACGSGSGSSTTTPSATTTTFQGTIAGSGSQTGTVTITVSAQTGASSASNFRLPFIATLHAESVSATGSVHLAGGATTSLTGNG